LQVMDAMYVIYWVLLLPTLGIPQPRERQSWCLAFVFLFTSDTYCDPSACHSFENEFVFFLLEYQNLKLSELTNTLIYKEFVRLYEIACREATIPCFNQVVFNALSNQPNTMIKDRFVIE
ncbi:hypothetical protein ACJX0J_005717, partial [Zea mays]